ncbi:hypothetical protein [Caulobacter segnis]|uniref:Uncharacterized protein n=1 Tax=Caulobacter segnis TaxID=88688 RepID=A0A2W5X659_9CAUL|nr:hypothetical protein [Caulobacter segnis]PZR32301.1 MAG: hypothetical protein DI526_17150 [Caulobacter segnis]
MAKSRIFSFMIGALLAIALGDTALAAAKIRVEYVRLNRGGDEKTPATQLLSSIVGPATTITAGATSVQSGAAPSFAPDRQYSGGVFARITPLQGAAIVLVGDNPTASETSGVRISVGQDPIYLPVTAGQKVAAIEAGDGAAAPPSAPLTYSVAAGSPFTLTSAWTKVVTTTAATKALSISDVTGGAYDVRWTTVAAGAAAPSSGEPGQNIGFQETFPFGVPIGDVYLRSASGAQASVYKGD